MTLERIILVHGTGASEPGAPGQEKWWQIESDFVADLGKQLTKTDTNKVFAFESFVWSGENSESGRRRAGYALQEKLALLEREATAFHLIGHSHGGSVIWHALKRMSRSKCPVMLRSWTTVGTPFLTFSGHGLNHVLMFFAAAAICVAVIVMFLAEPYHVYAQEFFRAWRDANRIAVIAFMVGVAGALGLAVGSSYVVLLQFFRRWGATGDVPDENALQFVANRWLPVYHRDDEPIVGLGVSVIHPALSTLPRMGTARKTETAASRTGWTGILRVLTSPVALVYDKLTAPLIDQFLWETLKRVAQGNDVAGEYMTRCGPAPPELEQFSVATPEKLQTKLTSIADSAATMAAGKFRTRFSGLLDGTHMGESLSGAFTWREVIHTSYFEREAGMAKLIAAFLSNPETFRQSLGQVAKPAVQLFAWHPRLLNFSRAALLALAGIAVSASTLAVDRAWLRPFTNAFQISANRTEFLEAQSSSLRLMPDLDKLLVRWVLLDRTTDAITIANRLDQDDRTSAEVPNARGRAYMRLAYAAGLKGSDSDLREVLSGIKCEGEAGDPTCLEQMSREEMSAHLLLYGIVGSIMAGNQSNEKIKPELLSAIKAFSEPYFRESFVELAMKVGAYDLAAEVSGSMQAYCNGINNWISKAGQTVSADWLPAKARACFENDEKASVTNKYDKYENQFRQTAGEITGIYDALDGTTKKKCAAHITLTTMALEVCLSDRANLRQVSEPNPQNTASELQIQHPSDMIMVTADELTNGKDTWPPCVDGLQSRLMELKLCIDRKNDPEESGAVLESPPQVFEVQSALTWWTTEFWPVTLGNVSTQPLCSHHLPPGTAYGSRLRSIASVFRPTPDSYKESISGLAEKRTTFELSKLESDNLAIFDSDVVCDLAATGLVWLWLGEPEQAMKLLGPILALSTSEGPSEFIDLFLAIADVASTSSPDLAKLFVDAAMDHIDDSDPSFSRETSDGSPAQFYTYSKTDIARLYARLGEYRLAALANARTRKFDDGAVAGYLHSLDNEIFKSRRYDDKVLRAAENFRDIPIFF